MHWTISLATQMITCWDSAVFHIGLSKLKRCILLLSAFHPVFLGTVALRYENKCPISKETYVFALFYCYILL